MSKTTFVRVILSISFAFLFVSLCTVGASTESKKDQLAPQSLVDATVTIQRDGSRGFGSGVTFINGDKRFVWTDAHVIESGENTEVVYDTKLKRRVVKITYDRFWVHQEVYQKGEKVGKIMRLARVVRYHRPEDIALLEVAGTNWPKVGVKFHAGVPKAGTKLWHVGTFENIYANSSLSNGVFSNAGRLRSYFRPDDKSGIIYDQVTMPAHPGSSGGGVFLKSDHQCIGLVTEGISYRTRNAICITPSRRILDFAKKHDCLWAVDASVKVPKGDLGLITRNDVPLTDDMKKKLDGKDEKKTEPKLKLPPIRIMPIIPPELLIPVPKK